ncbi:putative lipase [Campylobacter ornithocola]|nr:putative lipase [Campylobacter ornithocola]
MRNKKYNIVLIGESHFIMKNGFQSGLESEITNVFNLSLGASPAIQSLYEIIRNRSIFMEADLIIFGSNTVDVIQYNSLQLLPISIQVINWVYEELFFFRKKIFVFIAPNFQNLNQECVKQINYHHRKLCLYYGYNFIDMHDYYIENKLQAFQKIRDGAHDFNFIMRELGKNIIKNIDFFHLPLSSSIHNSNPNFRIFTFNDEIKNEIKKNSLYCEKIFPLESVFKLEKYIHYTPIGIHTWNSERNNNRQISIVNDVDTIKVFPKHPWMQFLDFYDRKFKITKDTKIVFTHKTNFIALFLADLNNKPKVEKIPDIFFENELKEKYNFNHLIPPIKWYKEIIDEYCGIVDPRKLAPLQNRINTLYSTVSLLEQDNIFLKKTLNSLSIKKLEIKTNSAKTRIQNQLSYKLGQAMIVNSKSFLGYIRMPFVLSYIYDKHKQEQKIYQEKIKKDPSLKLPSLESYPDYKEALKEKECFTYKLGKALIQANKTWYGGGYIKLLFEIRKLKRVIERK